MQFGKYRLIRKLATGGMAEIFLARQDGIEGFQKDIVIKRILPVHADNDELIDMFLDEARIAATLNHPNIAHIFDLGRTEGEFFIAMEYIHGQDLRRICERGLAVGNFLPLRHAARIIADSAAGLHYAHNQADTQGRPMNIVHRDVSPQNITVSFDGVAKLLDFGIAKAANKIVTTRHGQLKGKYAYMSPEQCNGLEIDHRSDIFSLGTLLYEITVCTRLFRGETDIQTIKNVSEARITPPSEVRPEYPRDLEAIVLKALAADPHNRYQSARELQEALEDFLQNNRMKTGPVQLGNYMREIFPDKLAHPEPDPELVGESPLPADETAPTNLWPAPEPETADLAEPEAPSAAPTADDIRAWTRGDSADMASPEEILASTPTPAPMPAVSAGPPGKPRPGGGAPRPGGGAPRPGGGAPRPGGGAPRPEEAPEKSSGEAVSFVVNQNAPYKVDADVKEFKRKKGPRKVERSAVKTVEYQLRSASDNEPDSYEKGSRIYFYILGIVVVGMLIYAGVLIYQKGNPLAGSNMLVEGAAPVIDAEPEPMPPELPSTLANIGTNPPGAAVVVNGILQSGETPGDFKVVPGQINSISLFLAGHEPVHRNIAVPDSGSPDAMSVTLAAVDQEALNPEEDFGKLTIESEPPGAAVVLNGQASGSTPFALEKAIGGQEYHVVLRKQGFRDQVIIQHVYANADNRPPLQKLIPDDRKTADRFTELNIEPREVTINLNDDFVGRGPRFIQRGRNEAIRVELKDDGYHPWRRVLTTTVAAITINPGLKKINRDPGKLSIKLTPNKNIMVFVGSEQYEPKELKKLEMPAGEYTVTLVKEDRSRGEVTVAVEPGIQRNWEINFEGDKPVATSKD